MPDDRRSPAPPLAVRGTRILNKELYVGRMVWYKLSHIKDPDTLRRVSRLNDAAQ